MQPVTHLDAVRVLVWLGCLFGAFFIDHVRRRRWRYACNRWDGLDQILWWGAWLVTYWFGVFEGMRQAAGS